MFTIFDHIPKHFFFIFFIATKCKARIIEGDSFVCVCNGNFCDVIEDIKSPQPGTFKRIISSRDKHRFTVATENENESPLKGLVNFLF